jgi:hypothetical protein
MRTFKAAVVTALGGSILASSGAGAFADSATKITGEGNEAPRRMASLDPDYAKSASTTNPKAEGRARLTLLEDDSRICYRVRVSGMTTRAVYVYRRATDVLITRLYDEAPTDADVLKGCVADVPADVLSAYREQPRRFYVEASSYDGADEIGGTLRRPR